MPALGKEVERQLTSDELALKEIQGYIDRIERQSEVKDQQSGQQQTAMAALPKMPQIVGDDQTVMGGPKVGQPKRILLPLDQTELEGGLKLGVTEAVRWLSEWCVMMIKKYPGRVFYLSKNITK